MKQYHVSLISGDGIGPEISSATVRVLDATGVKIHWEYLNAGEKCFEATGELVPEEVFQSLERNRVGLKGPITTPIGKGFRSINVMLRKKYELYANIRPVLSMDGIKTPFKNIDLVIFRENTEDLYIGNEVLILPGHAEAIKVVTEASCERIVRKAFEFAQVMGRKKVTAVHKANILKLTDGLFLDTARRIALEYPSILFEDILIDNMCMQLVLKPESYDIIVTLNLYGDILSDLCAGLVGGLGIVPGANIGEDMAIFEAVHGSAPDIAGKGLANPTAMMLSGAMLLDYLGESDASSKLRNAIAQVYTSGTIKTKDLGGHATTEEFADAVIEEMSI